MSDKKALKILFNKYWSPAKGWQKNKVTEEDYLYAKAAGVMFDDITTEHEKTVQKAIDVCDSIGKQKVVDAFVSSLSSRRLELRSALSSYACGQNLPSHKFMQSDINSFSKICQFCTESSIDEKSDLNVLNFERHKFGGVRHLQPNYIWLDLMLLGKENIQEPSSEDIELLKGILGSLESLVEGKLSDAEKSFKSIIKSNKNERVGIISALGYCGILEVPDYPSFHQKYIPFFERRYSSNSRSDWPFPADLWVPSLGLNKESISYWFGKYI
ncbi:hypothetical protein [Aliikangiella sp. G2MR2-5]|uniref:hypothetical protein n=1 Tax=Aliikangiella sp. G2MR2-5 TaxID=2788943 RepID=UPI0018A8869B|nr:hypothetical protein [Aliikangiella sp. G2MR2-5]